jgi:hypothetical protein
VRDRQGGRERAGGQGNKATGAAACRRHRSGTPGFVSHSHHLCDAVFFPKLCERDLSLPHLPTTARWTTNLIFKTDEENELPSEPGSSAAALTGRPLSPLPIAYLEMPACLVGHYCHPPCSARPTLPATRR